MRYTSVLDQYLVHRFQKHKLPAVAAALMWLTLLVPMERAPWRLEGHELIAREAEWVSDVRTFTNDEIQFRYFFKCFLSNPGRSGNIFVGRAITITHFAQVCAQRAWRGISVLDHPSGSENWRYIHSAISNALLDNILDRLLVYLYDVMNLLIPGYANFEESSKLADEMLIQNIKVSQALISLSLGPLNHNIFIRHTKMRISDIVDLVKFVEATATEDQTESFESQMLRWRNNKTKVTAPIGFTMVRSPFIFGVACVKSCSTDISIPGTIW